MAKSFKTSISIDDAGSAASEALRTKVAGDSNARLLVDIGGKLTWGPGDGAGDVTLYRSAANILKTDDSLQAVAGLITSTTSGAPSASIADGAISIDTSNDAFYFRSSSSWQQVSGGGASVTVSDGAPSSPSAGDLWYESDTGNTIVYYDDGVGAAQWVELGHAADSTVVEYAANIDGGVPSSNYTGIATLDGGAV